MTYSEMVNSKEIGICSFCTDQVPPNQVAEHAKTCSLIPDDERARIIERHEGAVAVIEVKGRQP